MNKIQTSTPHFELVIEGIHKFVNDVLNSDNAEQKKKLRETIHEVAKLLHSPETDESDTLLNESNANVLEMKKKNTDLEQETIESEKKIQLDSPDDVMLKLMVDISNGTKIPVLKIKKLDANYLPMSKTGKRSIKNNELPLEKKSKVEQIRKKIELPNEIWLKIMNCMTTTDVFLNFRLVCKNFSALTSDLSYLEITSVHDTKMSQYESALKQLKNTNRLKEIRILQSDRTKILMTQAIKLNKNIKSIKLSNYHSNKVFRFTTDFVNKIQTFCNDLKHLELRNVHIEPDVVDQVSKIQTLKTFMVIETTQLKQWVAPKQRANTSENILSFAMNCKDLEAISFCVYIENWEKEIYHKKMKDALDTFFLEKRLTLKRFSVSKFTTKSTEIDNYEKILENLNLCQNIEELFIKHFILEGSNLIAITQLPRLKKLVLKNIKTNICELFHELQRSNLKYLAIIIDDEKSIQDFSSKASEFFKMKFPSLERFALAIDSNSKTKISELTLNEFVESAPKLKSVQLQGISFCNNINENIVGQVCTERDIFICFETFSRDTDYQESCDYFQIHLEKNLSEKESILKVKYDNLKSQFLAWNHRNIWWSQVLKDMH